MHKLSDSEILAAVERFIAGGFEDEKRARTDSVISPRDKGWYDYGKSLARHIQIMRGEAISDNAPGRN